MASYINKTDVNPDTIIYRRADSGPTWQYRIKLAGKIIRKSTKTTDKQRAARVASEVWKDIVRRHDSGRPIHVVTLKDVAAAAIKYWKNGSKLGAGREQHISQVKRYILPILGSTDIDSVGTASGIILADNLRSRGLSASTINNVLVSLRHILRYAATCNPPHILTPPEIESVGLSGQQPRPAFTKDEIFSTICVDILMKWSSPENQHDYDLALLVTIMMTTGLRPSSIMRLRWSDVEIDGEDVYIRAVTKKGRRNKGRTPKPVMIMIHNEVETSGLFRSVVMKRKKGDDEHIISCNYEPGDSPEIIESKQRNRVNFLGKMFQRLLKDRGIEYNGSGEKRTLYSVRHYYITDAIESGVDVYTVARSTLTSVQMIEEYYDKTKFGARRRLRS